MRNPFIFSSRFLRISVWWSFFFIFVFFLILFSLISFYSLLFIHSSTPLMQENLNSIKKAIQRHWNKLLTLYFSKLDVVGVYSVFLFLISFTFFNDTRLLNEKFWRSWELSYAQGFLRKGCFVSNFGMSVLCGETLKITCYNSWFAT